MANLNNPFIVSLEGDSCDLYLVKNITTDGSSLLYYNVISLRTEEPKYVGATSATPITNTHTIKTYLKDCAVYNFYDTGDNLPSGRTIDSSMRFNTIGLKKMIRFQEKEVYTIAMLKLGGEVIWTKNKGWIKDKKSKIEPEPKQEQQTEVKHTQTQSGMLTIEQQIINVVEGHLSSSDARQSMAQGVENLLNEWGISKSVKTIEVKRVDGERVKVGQVHKEFDSILTCVTARVNIALVGPAGSGKTTTVHKVAEALGLKFYSKSVSAQTGSHEFFGYQDAQGRYVRTLFRDAYENGGVFLLDEFDAGNPNVLAALNQATANGSCAFADGMIDKHEDFVCIMAGNTYGHGATSDYVGRNPIDAATLDRFVFIRFDYDEDLELALAPNKDWCIKVQAIRKRAIEKRVKTVISPRATIMGGQLLNAGMREKKVMDIVIHKGLTRDEINLITKD